MPDVFDKTSRFQNRPNCKISSFGGSATLIGISASGESQRVHYVCKSAVCMQDPRSKLEKQSTGQMNLQTTRMYLLRTSYILKSTDSLTYD